MQVWSGLLSSLAPAFCQFHQAFSAALDLELPKAPCDSSFLDLFEQVELVEAFTLLREWMPT